MAFGEGKIWFDGQLVDWNDANIHVMAHVVHYGSSVFEGVRCYNTPKGPAVFRMKEHVQRMFDSAKIYRMDLGMTQREFIDAILQTIRANSLSNCYIRPIAFRGLGPMGVNPLKNPVHVVIGAWEWGAYLGAEALENGVHVMTASWNRAAPNTFPSMAKAGGNYINSQLIKMDAVLSGYDEGIALDTSGYVSEGSGENIFVIKNGKIFTPPACSCILPGITRDSIIAICGDLGLTVQQEQIPRELLIIADEVFLTGSAAEVTPVSKIDNAPIGSGRRGPISEKIQKTFFDIVHGEAPDNHGWLMHV